MKNKLLIFITPLILLLICCATAMVALIKPYNKVSVYLNLAFMDEFKTNPNDGSGLVIKDGTINTDYQGETANEGNITFPSFGQQYAVLSADSLENNIPVYWGCTNELFERGACQSTFSKVLGDSGNTVISAHEDTFFADLYKIKPGEKITLYTNYGCFIYEVSENISFKKTEKKYVNPGEEEKLTLYTCKKDILGSSDQRIGVVCKLIEKKFYLDTEEDK